MAQFCPVSVYMSQNKPYCSKAFVFVLFLFYSNKDSPPPTTTTTTEWRKAKKGF